MNFNILKKNYLLHALFMCILALSAGDASAGDPVLTPAQTEGPFYPDKFPVDTDNDLLLINNSEAEAIGDVIHLTGVVMDSGGKPIQNAVVEIWQADSNRVYLHSRSPDQDKRDKNFQGFGRVITGPAGEYYFRTIKPVSYTMGRITRAPHIHFIIRVNGKRMLTTQMYIRDNSLNEKDMVLQGIRDSKQRESLQPEFIPEKNKKNEYSVNFNIVLGTVSENPKEDDRRYLDGSLSR
jgi:protocatechuate 3,4-dioxygenase beta subunit